MGDVDGMPQVLLRCTAHAADRKIPRDDVRGADRPAECLHGFLLPTGPPLSVRFVFVAVTAFLAKSGIDRSAR